MIWFALRVDCGREFVCERILKTFFRETRAPVDVAVPVKHVVRKAPSKVGKRVVRSKPRLPGILFIGVASGVQFPVAQLERFAFVHGLLRDNGDRPLTFRELDMTTILGELNQRPIGYRLQGRHRKSGSFMEIVDGPYEGRTVRARWDDTDGGIVTYLALSGFTKEYEELKFDNDHNQSYVSAPDAPLAVADTSSELERWPSRSKTATAVNAS
jgi:hypothetical protein